MRRLTLIEVAENARVAVLSRCCASATAAGSRVTARSERYTGKAEESPAPRSKTEDMRENIIL